MWTLYESLLSLCNEKGIKGGKMCTDLGFSKSLMTDLKAGRKKSINADTAQKIADYFGVSVDRVLGKENLSAPSKGSSEITEDDFTYAMFKETRELSPETKEQLLQMARFFAEEEKRKRGK